LCETEFLALANVQVDLVSNVRDYGGALENVRSSATRNLYPPLAEVRT
jgi:hypothetical protein